MTRLRPCLAGCVGYENARTLIRGVYRERLGNMRTGSKGLGIKIIELAERATVTKPPRFIGRQVSRTCRAGLLTVALFASNFSNLPALAYDLAPAAKITATAAGCTCNEGGKMWPCRKMIDNASQCAYPLPLRVTCEPGAPCVYVRECAGLALAGTENICVLQDKPK